MSKQPKALELANQLKERYGATVPTSQAAAELRRLHSLNAELVEALKICEYTLRNVRCQRAADIALKSIEKAKEDQQ